MESLPRFRTGRTALAAEGLRYNPQNDIIFPTVFRAADHLERPLGRYYLYYAPHSQPGGLCVAFADDLSGQWREHPANPLIAGSWPPNHDVEHVSSPHALWREDLGEIWLYYHGDNDTTRWATSKDGLHFEYGGEAIHAPPLGMDGASYARVFQSPFAAAPAPYLMTLLLYQCVEGSWDRYVRHGLFGAWSTDGARWELVPRPILGQEDLAEGAFVCSPFVTRWGERVFMLYHLDEPGDDPCLSDAYAVEIDVRLMTVGEPFLVCSRRAFGETNERIADPFLIVDGGRSYLFGSIGPRLGQRIGVSW
jgi:hypothetical protein